MRPMLDDLELPQVQEAALAERRELVEHPTAELDGGVLQDLGRRPSRFTVAGVAAGPDAAAFIEKLSGKFREGLPVAFTADVGAGSRIDQVRIADLRVEELAGKPQRWMYLLSLSEHQEPVQPQPSSAVDAAVIEEAQGMIDDLVVALDLAPLFLTGLEPFIPMLQGVLASLRGDEPA
jgi:hypothetical protein